MRPALPLPGRLAAPFFAAVLFACTAAPPPAPPAVAFSAGRSRVVLISFDGVGGERLTRLLANPRKLTAGGYRRIAEQGLFARGSVPPTPSLTAVAHVTHVTGALPEATGIVSNTMLDRSKPFPATLSGFDAPIRAETLWEAARRQGRRVGVMLYPGADGKTPARSADWAMTWPGAGLSRAELHNLEASAWQAAGEPTADSFSVPRRATLKLGKTAHSVRFLALDGTDDGKVNYDRLRVEPQVGAPSEVRPAQWFSLEVSAAQGRTGAWGKVLTLAPDLSKAEIYVGSLHRNTGYPAEFVRRLDERIGFWPGPPDDDAFGAESGRPEVFLEQVERLADFITRAQLFAIARSDWDLLLCYQPEADETGHEFLLADGAPAGPERERAARFEQFVDTGYEIADRSLRAIEAALSPGVSIFVTSDHGMVPVRDEIYLNEILRQAGLLRAGADREVDPASAAVAVTSGAIGHVYLNSSSAPDTLPRVEAVLREFRVRGESPWDSVTRREEAGPLGLRAPESGDLIVLGRPGFHFSARLPEGQERVGPAEDRGAHGYRNVYPELYASFLAAGPGIRRERIDRINSWTIAAHVSRALGIEPPRQAAREDGDSAPSPR